MIPHGFEKFDYMNPPEIETPLLFQFFDGDILNGVLTWDEERRVYVFYSDEQFYDCDDVKFWKYK